MFCCCFVLWEGDSPFNPCDGLMVGLAVEEEECWDSSGGDLLFSYSVTANIYSYLLSVFKLVNQQIIRQMVSKCNNTQKQ